MSELLPPRQARELRQRLLDYLTTTFALADTDARLALTDFLDDPDDGVFKGPYLRTRLPFRPAPQRSADGLGWMPDGFRPYGHQAQAFFRLNSALGRPQPTLVTTGTGSGKTESFLLPVLDHVLRARREGVPGTKALILYPMNALASDQAGRLARLIAGSGLPVGQPNPLASVTAALYTGEQQGGHTLVSADGLITDRDVIRSQAPDILLTNYKMLDQMLLRAADQRIWEQSADSLQYVVLDEFHTYDGAQGTDVAMLLRRLGLALKSHWPARGSDLDTHTPQEWDRPLGRATPVGTSATLGGGDDLGTAHMVEFATTIFGERFDTDCVIPETRLSDEEWRGDAERRVEAMGLRPVTLTAGAARELHRSLEQTSDAAELCRQVLGALYEPLDADAEPVLPATDHDTLLLLAKAHPMITALCRATAQATHVNDLAEQLIPDPGGSATSLSERAGFVLDLVSALAHLRATPSPGSAASSDRSALSTETHLWIRELSRIDRSVDTRVTFRWTDDGVPAEMDATTARQTFLPAIYCRHCGRSGWGVQLATTGTSLSRDDTTIRSGHAARTNRFRALLPVSPIDAVAQDAATGTADGGTSRERGGGEEIGGPHNSVDTRGPASPADPRSSADHGPNSRVMWLHPGARTLEPQPPTPDDTATATPEAEEIPPIPVLTLDGPDADDLSNEDRCPSCDATDGIRFMGSAIATLLSVSLSNLFGSDTLDTAEKKALVFTDSIQDAAHQAGFVTARSRRITLRSVLREALGQQRLTAEQLAHRVIADAGEDPFRRYRVLPVELATLPAMEAFWRKPGSSDARKALDKVRRRLLFDVELEFGLESRVGRTLEHTGAVNAHVEAGSDADLARHARLALAGLNQDTLDETLTGHDDLTLARWVRGVLERMRSQGSIAHPWLEDFVKEDGNRYRIWGGRKRNEGMPAFPRGRSTPSFPFLGGPSRSNGAEMLLDPVSHRQSWYAGWTARVLGASAGAAIPRQVAARLAAALMRRLADAGVVQTRQTEAGRTVLALDPASIVLAPSSDEDLSRGRVMLRCDTCHSPVPAAPEATRVLAEGPCLSGACSGTLWPEQVDPANSYRTLYDSTDMVRVNAREHTALVPDSLRHDYENGFKYGSPQGASAPGDPSAPNVLVATPTLEMGIDIGDLSTVMLSSLPPTVAKYVQRVGRAGRLTGNALDLAYVRGRGEHLPRLGDPSSFINGAVQPPATYLSAEEILKRQYIAHLADQLARDDVDSHHPQKAAAALAAGTLEESDATGESYLSALVALAEQDPAAHLDTFLAGFLPGQLSESATTALRSWATPTTGPRSSGLAGFVRKAIERWRVEQEDLAHQKDQIARALPDLRERANGPAAADEDKQALRTAIAALSLVNEQLKDKTSEYWVGALERQGLLPNYTLLDDNVRLDVTMTWYEEDKGGYDKSDACYARPSTRALRDFAPGATFFANGHAVRVDTVKLGSGEAERVRTMAVCPECGHCHDLAVAGVNDVPSQCPRCASPDIADVGSRLDVVEFYGAEAHANRESSRITDRDDVRAVTPFTIVLAADIDPAAVTRQWFVEGSEFGAKMVSPITLRWFNLGRRRGGGEHQIAGNLVPGPLFRVCAQCGHLDSTGQRNIASEHVPWCPQRKSDEEDTRLVALTRTLNTQGVVLPLPWTVTTGDDFAVPSLVAAVLMGLRHQFGGSPDHIGVSEIVDPAPDGRVNNRALLLHDLVPGGTGYLAQLCDPDHLWAVLHEAWRIVHDCPCRQEERLACHRCLLPFTEPSLVNRVSRASAEQHLRTLLVGHQDDETIDPTPTPTWPITTVQTKIDPDDESVLEQRFRSVFMARAEALGQVTQSPRDDGYNDVRVTTTHGGPDRVRLRPQVRMTGTRPDFVLDGVGARDVAIYTDGYAFHATAATNRLADDATKRALLRAEGTRVLAATMDDCRAPAPAEHPRPCWLDDAEVDSWRPVFNYTVDAVTALTSGPFGYLSYLLQHMPAPPLAAFSDAVPVLLANQAVPVPDPGGDLARVAADLVTGAGQPSSEQDGVPSGEPSGVHSAALWWNQGPLGALIVLHQGQYTLTADLCVILDDRDPTVPGFRRWWQEWLWLSNALVERSPGQLTEITTVTAARANPVVAHRPAATASQDHRSSEWAQVASLLGPDAEVVTRLEQADVPAPDAEVGHEVGGVPCDLAWTDARVAVILQPQSGDEELLAEDGWRMVAPDPRLLLSALGGQ